MKNKPKPLAFQAYEVIKRDILTCVLEEGSLIAQSEMVERYNFSVTPVRDALKRLEAEGYVQSIPRFGYLVSSITSKDIEELYELRHILEIAAVRLAIQRASPEQIAKLEKQANFTYTFKNPESYLHFLEDNAAFHVSIALMSGNYRLADALDRVLSDMNRIFHLGLDLRDSAEEMRGEHQALVAALSARDVLRAEQIIQDQIDRSRQRVLEMLHNHHRQALFTDVHFNH